MGTQRAGLSMFCGALAALSFSGGAAAAVTPISLTTFGTAYTQNFDGLSNTAGSTTNTLSLAGWEIAEGGGGARDNEQYAVDTGASTTGDIYSYGAAGSTDRALGTLRSGTLIPMFGVFFTNNTGNTVTSLTIAYTGELWRLGAAARTDQLDFQYSIGANALDAAATWTDVNALDFITPNTTTVGSKDGNAAANRTALGTTISGLSIASGTSFWLRWIDADPAGSDDGLAIDNFSLTAQGATGDLPEPSTLALAGLALSSLALRRRLR